MDIIERLKIKAREHNMIQIRKEIEQDWVSEKIENFLERNKHIKLNKEEMKKEILINDVIASFFAKDPSKQNISEKYFTVFISKIKGIENFIKPRNNEYCFLIDGKITYVEERPIGLKNIDYVFNFNGFQCICTQKYTQGKGGHQDNQYNDVVSFIKNALNLEEKTIVIALLDGDYYTKNLLEDLKKINNNDKQIIICSAFDLEDELNEKCK